VKVMEMNT